MGGYWYAPDDHAADSGTTHGSAHSVSDAKPEKSAAEKVRDVAEEVSRKVMPKPPVRRIGF